MFGIHVSKTSKVEDRSSPTLADAVAASVDEFKIDCAQIFTHGPSSTRRNHYDEKPLPDMPIFIHGAYMWSGLWSGKISKDFIKSEVTEANAVKAAGLVIHINDLPPARLREEIQKHVVPMYHELRCRVPLLLEMPAKRPRPGSPNYATAEDLGALTREMRRLTIPWGLCLDTSHVWAGGVDLSSPAVVKDWLAALDPEHIGLIHLNSNQRQNKGTGKDLHTIPYSRMDGIWGDEDAGLRAIVKYAKKNRIPCLLEANRGAADELHHALTRLRRL